MASIRRTELKDVVAQCTPFVVTRGTEEGLDQTTRAIAKSPARLTTSKDEEKDERMYGESFKPGSHRDSSHRRTRHLRGRREQEGEDGGPRRREELFSNVSRRGDHRQTRETGKRNERTKQTRRPDEASTIWEMKCRRIGKV